MKAYENILTNYTPASVFPTVTAVNASAGSTADGTEWIKALADELISDQAIVNHSGQTPSGVTDTGSGTGATGSSASSQRLIAIQKVAGAPGELVGWMGANVDPSLGVGGDARLLPLIGQTIAIASYPDLVTATYKGDGTNPTTTAFYKVDGANVRDTAGANYVLPDLRGYFPRGIDTGATVDPDGAGRVPGDPQVAAVGDHTHQGLYNGNNEASSPYGLSFESLGAGAISAYILETSASFNPHTGYAVQRTSGSIIRTADNRPVNFGVHWCIRY